VDTQLIVFCSHLVNSILNGSQVDVIYADIKKTFDSVDYKIKTINKLKNIGVSGSILAVVLYSYPSDPTQIVTIPNGESKPLSVSSGVIQGGLSSFLLLVFIINIKILFKL